MTIHGYVWHNRFQGTFSKAMVFLVITMVLATFQIYSVKNTIDWYNSPDVLTRETKKEVFEASYPNVTVCHPGYFNMIKAKGV